MKIKSAGIICTIVILTVATYSPGQEPAGNLNNKVPGGDAGSKYNFSFTGHLTTIDGKINLIASPEIGMTIENQFRVGIRLNVPVLPVVLQGFEDSNTWMFDAGIQMDYVFMPDKKIHPVAGLFTGFGFLFLEDSFMSIYEFNPCIMLEKNCGKKLKTSFGAGFRVNNPLDIYSYKYGYISAPELLYKLSYCF